MINEQEILRVDVNRIYEQIDTIKEDVNELKLNKVETTTLMKGFFSTQKTLTDSLEKLSSTMNNVQLTMVDIQGSLKEIHRELYDTKQEVYYTKQEVSDIEKKVNNDIEKNKVDLRDINKEVNVGFLKQHWAKLLGFSVGGASLIGIISVLIKILDALNKLQK